MTLPKAVAAATEELAALEQQLQAPVESDLPPDGQTEETPPALEPAPEPVPAAPVASSDVPPEVPEEKWEHKYRRLQGKYDAEVPRLHAQLREMQTAIQQMQHAQQAPPPSPVPEKAAEPEKYVSDEDIVTFGEDYVDLQRRVALDTTRELRKQVELLKAQMAQQGSQVQTVTFESQLAQAVPDFKDINVDPAWIEWLNEFDPLLRAPRRAIAQQAYARGDVDAVKSYVELFKQAHGAPPAPPPEPQKPSRQQELQRQVQPSRASASAPTTGAKKTYTMGEAEALFNRISHLTAQGRIDEAKRLDAEISAAYAEGRISV